MSPVGVRKIKVALNAISNRFFSANNQFHVQQRYPANAVNYCKIVTPADNFTNSLYPAICKNYQQDVRQDLDPNCLTL